MLRIPNKTAISKLIYHIQACGIYLAAVQGISGPLSFRSFHTCGCLCQSPCTFYDPLCICQDYIRILALPWFYFRGKYIRVRSPKKSFFPQNTEEICQFIHIIGAVRESEARMLVSIRPASFFHHCISDMQVCYIRTQGLNHKTGCLIGGWKM